MGGLIKQVIRSLIRASCRSLLTSVPVEMGDFTYEVVGNVVTFTNPEGVTGEWDFGDGFTSSDVDPVHEYNQHGVYDVELEGPYNASITIVEQPMPVAEFTTEVGDPGSNVVTFTATGGVSYIWTIEAGDHAGTIYEHTFSSAGDYSITLAATDSVGNVGAATSTLTVQMPNVDPVLNLTASKALLVVDYDAGATDDIGEVLTYAWTFSDEQTSTLAAPQITYATDGTYTGTVVVNDDRGGESTDFIDITVSSTPELGAELINNFDFITDDDAAGWDFYQATSTWSSDIDGAGNEGVSILATGTASLSAMKQDIDVVAGEVYQLIVRQKVSNLAQSSAIFVDGTYYKALNTQVDVWETPDPVLVTIPVGATSMKIWINCRSSALGDIAIDSISVKEVL